MTIDRGDRMSSVPSGDSSVGLDGLLLKMLTDGAGEGLADPAAVADWWRGGRLAGEGFSEFLVREGVLAEPAARTVRLAAKGYVQLADSNGLFGDGGLEAVRRRLSEAIARVRRPVAPPIPAAAGPGVPAPRPDGSSNDGLTGPLTRGSDAAPGETDSLLGRVLGQYKILRRVGRGAKGVVYEAEDELLARRVAVKVLSPELVGAGDVAVRRFLLEARAAAKLDHPNCVGVYTIGKEQGLVFFSMPLVFGRSAQEALDERGTLPAAEAVRVAELAARGLEAAHALGIVHRDVKPGNILLGDNGEVRVTDFGMAKATDDMLSGLTEPGRWLGTPHFMSPEQCRGGTVDARSDVYSLGATLFALLTGRPPFAGTGPAALIYRQVADPHPDPRTIEPSIPEACVALIDRAMAKNPDDRPPTAGRFAEELAAVRRALLRGEPTTALTGSGFASASATGPVPPSAQNPAALPADSLPRVGTVLGRCILTEKVGEGGSSVVFRALHRSLNVQVAVKVLTPADPQRDRRIRELMAAEARMLARLSHPHIVRVLDFDDEARHPYLILEYMHGLNLGELISGSGAVRPDRAVRIALAVAEGLGFALGHGVVHRDVKPGNILLSRDGNVKLADLGLAAFEGDTESAAGAGRPFAVGTPAYMAPEQVRGGPVDHRSDIYSLGVTLYHALAGRLPFEAADRTEMMRRHLDDTPAPLSAAMPDLDPGLCALVHLMLAKNPAARPQEYTDLISALRDVLAAMKSRSQAESSGDDSRSGSPSGKGWSLWRSLVRRLRPDGRRPE